MAVNLFQFSQSFKAVLHEKQKHNTYQDANKKKSQVVKENFWPVSSLDLTIQSWLAFRSEHHNLVQLREVPKQVIVVYYYTTKLLGGLIQKIHQSDRAIAGLIFAKYQTGSVRIRLEIELFKMADAEEIEVCKLSPQNTKQFLSRR